MASARVLVFWMDDKKTSIVDLGCVPEGDRDPGKIAKVKWTNGSSYPAQIIKIGKSMKNLEQAEASFLEKYNRLNKDVSGKRHSKNSVQEAVSAAAIKVARALGEQVQLPPQQAATKLAVSRERRFVNSNIRQSESTGDSLALQSENVSNVKRSLEFDSHQDGNFEDDADDGCDDAIYNTSSKRPKVLSDDGSNEHQSPSCLTPRSRCGKCRRLSANINPASVEFIKALAAFVDLAPTPDPALRPSPTSSDKSEAWQLKPLSVDPGHKKAELTAGSGLFLKKSSKVTSVVSAAGDAEKLTRNVIQDLYGDQLKQKGVSALGQGKSKKGIGKTDLKNIYAFVSRNSTITDRKGKKGELPDFTFQEFVRIVNKKLQSASRDRSNDTTSKRKLNLDNSELELAVRSLSKPATPVCAGTPSKSWNVQEESSTGALGPHLEGSKQVPNTSTALVQNAEGRKQVLTTSTPLRCPSVPPSVQSPKNLTESFVHPASSHVTPVKNHPSGPVPQPHSPSMHSDYQYYQYYGQPSYHQEGGYPMLPPHSQPYHYNTAYSMPPSNFGRPNHQHEGSLLLDTQTILNL